MTLFVDLAVGRAPGQLSLEEATQLSGVAAESGVSGIRLLDRLDDHPTFDPTTVAAYLAGRHPLSTLVVGAATTRNAPYNLARRILSLDRATRGRIGLSLLPGDGDDVSDAVSPQLEADRPGARWEEYAEVLARLWESFPASALIGDRESGVVVDDALIRPIQHEGAFYRVEGPLDGPSSPQGRPVIVIDDPEIVGWPRVARVADAVVVDIDRIVDAADALTAALAEAGRARSAVALLGRIADVDRAEQLSALLAENSGVGAVLTARDVGSTVEALRELAPQFASPVEATLRSTLGLPRVEQVLR